MKTISAEELKIILENHNHYIMEDCDGWEDMKANLSYTDLSGYDLINVNLFGADLSYADLSNAYLRGANLSYADLSFTNLHRVDLYGANLHRVDLYGADLFDACIKESNLCCAELSGAKNVPYIPMECPEEGSFIGWKKVDATDRKVIVKLSIPEDAKRSSATSRKCRCNKAKVVEIYNFDGTIAEERKCNSHHDKCFIYEVGKTVEVKNFNEDRWKECAEGIHFFMNRQEAINY